MLKFHTLEGIVVQLSTLEFRYSSIVPFRIHRTLSRVYSNLLKFQAFERCYFRVQDAWNLEVDAMRAKKKRKEKKSSL